MNVLSPTEFERIGAQCERDYNDYLFARVDSKRERKAGRKANLRLQELRTSFEWKNHLLPGLYDKFTQDGALHLAKETGRNLLTASVQTPFHIYCGEEEVWKEIIVKEDLRIEFSLIYIGLRLGTIAVGDGQHVPTGLVACGIGVDPTQPKPSNTGYLVPVIGNGFEPQGRNFN